MSERRLRVIAVQLRSLTTAEAPTRAWTLLSESAGGNSETTHSNWIIEKSRADGFDYATVMAEKLGEVAGNSESGFMTCDILEMSDCALFDDGSSAKSNDDSARRFVVMQLT